MSTYTLIKATSLQQRMDSISDLFLINNWLYSKGIKFITCYGKSLRAIENTIALCIEKQADLTGFPKLVRGESFYRSIISEIKPKERHKFNFFNDESYRDSIKTITQTLTKKEDMKKEKLYFQNENAEVCNPLEYFLHDAKLDGLKEITLIEAIPSNSVNDHVWCTYFLAVSERSECRKSICNKYESNKSGRGTCIHRGKLYDHGESFTFKITPDEHGE